MPQTDLPCFGSGLPGYGSGLRRDERRDEQVRSNQPAVRLAGQPMAGSLYEFRLKSE